MRSPFPIRVVFTLALCCGLSALAYAQGDPHSRPTTPPRNGGVRTVYIQSPPKIVKVTPTTGALTVVAEPGAVIKVERISRGTVIDSRQADIPAGEHAVIFNELKQGEYLISAALSGYKTDQKAKEVRPNTSDKVELNLIPITYDITINLNAGSGMVKVGDAEVWMPFEGGRIQLPGMRPGKYELEIRPNDAAYQQLKTEIDVSAATRDFRRELTKRESTTDFLSGSAGDWTLPDGWRFAPNLRVKSRGVALPRDDSFRYYKDFQLSTSVKLLNRVAAAFVLRAQDANNYYLIQLTGPDADEPYRLRGFIVENGVPRRFGTTYPIRNIEDALKSDNFFTLSLTMKDNNIEVKVLDNDSNRFVPLGNLTDPNSTFKIGAVGVAARDNEQFEIGQFIICASVCRN